MSPAALMLAAWAIEIAFGWPNWLFRLIRHPVVWFGILVRWLVKAFNQDGWPHTTRYIAGMVASLFAISLATASAWLIAERLPNTPGGFLLEALIASTLLASRSLYKHVADVARPLAYGDIDAARQSVSLIVGRDPAQLDEAGIARASIESLAENASDGVIAPLFWGTLLGLPGLVAYKAINTLDSMIGHRNTSYAAFGGFAARLDDVANLIPARLTGLVFACTSKRLSVFKVMIRDAGRHRSPNAGWPEAAMAAALGIRLSGPRIYGKQQTDDPWLNSGASDPSAQDIRRALSLYLKAMAICTLLLFVIVLLQVTV
tara:strand:+ start:1366 stop:2316 length:951 start_codon:yes stop_codon:yes gene_type:complete